MNLSNRQKAALATVGMLLGGLLGGCLVQFILTNVSAETIGLVFTVGFIAFIASMIYQLMLSRFEYIERMKALNKD